MVVTSGESSFAETETGQNELGITVSSVVVSEHQLTLEDKTHDACTKEPPQPDNIEKSEIDGTNGKPEITGPVDELTDLSETVEDAMPLCSKNEEDLHINKQSIEAFENVNIKVRDDVAKSDSEHVQSGQPSTSDDHLTEGTVNDSCSYTGEQPELMALQIDENTDVIPETCKEKSKHEENLIDGNTCLINSKPDNDQNSEFDILPGESVQSENNAVTQEQEVHTFESVNTCKEQEVSLESESVADQKVMSLESTCLNAGIEDKVNIIESAPEMLVEPTCPDVSFQDVSALEGECSSDTANASSLIRENSPSPDNSVNISKTMLDESIQNSDTVVESTALEIEPTELEESVQDEK